MSDIIHLLPDSIANQIAAGEVIQRPSSVVKELMENSIDAGASKICVVVKKAGMTSIQIVDNGKGMSHTDARMAFERHATSKISSANDIFSLSTMGFRGEALASIASVATVEMKTRQKDSDFGTFIEIAGNQIIKHENIACSIGTSFLVRNLFYNVPARRKFLKKEETELRHIISEFQRVALANPEIEFELYNDSTPLYELTKNNFKQRIVAVFSKKSKNYSSQLIDINSDTSIVKISGFVGTPQSASKNSTQFFFVNGRFMRHPYFNRAVVNAYSNMIQADTVPNYFINFVVNPKNIDVNIHPTKTEIKFEEERDIWAILLTSVKEALGKSFVMSKIDFENKPNIAIPALSSPPNNYQPQVNYSSSYNPFAYDSNRRKQPIADNWQILYDEPTQSSIPIDNENNDFLYYKKNLVITSVKSGLMIVDIRKAVEQVTYEKLLLQLQEQKSTTQSVLFPEEIELTNEELLRFEELTEDLIAIGFEFEKISKNLYSIIGIPSLLTDNVNIRELLKNIIGYIDENMIDKEIFEKIAIQISKTYSKSIATKLNKNEIEALIGSLFRCQNPNYTPEGDRIATIITDEELRNRFREV